MLDMEKYLTAKESTKVTVCDKCKDEFIISFHDLKVEGIVVGGENLTVTNFRCPRCEKMYVVLIDNVQTLQMKEYIRRELVKLEIMKRRRNDEIKIVKQIDKIQSKNKKLERVYKMLDSKYKKVFE